MHRILDICPETEALLIAIGEKMGITHDGLQTEEIMEIVIDGMANSVDAQFECATTGEGSPLSLQDAINAVMNPDMSTDFVQPTTVLETPYRLTWEDIMTDGDGYIYDDYPYSDVEKEAMIVVFNQLPKDQWASEYAQKLIDNTIKLLEKHA